jgi:hypothetical protein
MVTIWEVDIFELSVDIFALSLFGHSGYSGYSGNEGKRLNSQPYNYAHLTQCLQLNK